jgi:hypothetical protein
MRARSVSVVDRTERLAKIDYLSISAVTVIGGLQAEGPTMRENDLDYSRRRAKEEAARALSLADRNVASVHRQLAAAHRTRVAELSSAKPQLEAPWSLLA